MYATKNSDVQFDCSICAVSLSRRIAASNYYASLSELLHFYGIIKKRLKYIRMLFNGREWNESIHVLNAIWYNHFV